ncbi:A/G-specific adenine glycosylase [Corynebacterium sp. ES2794-CONJ1]|uniref:A/G-specific adenine glycosylase n=1 Tax=unclassified Corynebacterium TaxID=2624378 RepID=UPI002166FAA0|nr:MULTISPECIES: A/G-specific adenine glycosylase [unclassified Corynebacterium]MCS4490263.1 A/G-specific adenine glycosylase [Corynebacterium sp. ES2775-CONJ]MCS4491926.1 A/G-specific adenine glycosylase [Corynebacterium sp. ES2715-CONJ3]MCS4532031.1 A/G-specific adenine glycosylase [Corynebacterium sp. ES2730-CONJ]MCU9519432.1 A/G-specific adenine glycosylase [Corynebacterium sp. ES2794-CONJ1]
MHTSPSPQLLPPEDLAHIQNTVIQWYSHNAREIIWRTPATSAWGILVSEVMSQQTPVARVEPLWQAWMHRWPEPRDLAHAPTADILKAWDRLGYPRRALRLKECATVIAHEYGNEVPSDLGSLLSLPGIGTYTAAAVAAFAFGQRVPVLDTNVRRVLSRLIYARYLNPKSSTSKRELRELEDLLPASDAPQFSVGLMELGALVCKTIPACDRCPLTGLCAWQRAGCPEPSTQEREIARHRVQKFSGTDREVRGKIMAVLRHAEHPVSAMDLATIWPDSEQYTRALEGLIRDKLAQESNGFFHLPH